MKVKIFSDKGFAVKSLSEQKKFNFSKNNN